MKEEQKEVKVTYGFWSPAICLRRSLPFITGKRNRGAMVIVCGGRRKSAERKEERDVW